MGDDQINLLRIRKLRGWSEIVEPDIKKPNKKRLFLFIIIIILVLIFISTAVAISKKRANSKKIIDGYPSIDNMVLQPKKKSFLQTVKNFIFGNKEVMEGQKQDRVNILLLGIGGEGHDGPYLSDTNIIFSIKPSTNQVSMISIPRDLAAEIDEYGWYKINHANSFGEEKYPGSGGEFARKIFEKTLGIEIPYYVRVDFKAFVELINTVGGIDIEVPRSFVDYSYPGPNYTYQTVSFKNGKETMDGQRALIYARSRHGTNNEGSDFARAKRQQLVIASLKKKMLSAGTYLNPIKLQKIIGSLSAHINTNLDFGQITYLGSLANKIDNDKIKTLVLDSSPQGFLNSFTGSDGAYLLGPRTGNFDEIKNAINNVFTATSTTQSFAASEQSSYTLPSANIEIQNGTWQVGLASKIKNDLEEKGFFVGSISNSYKRPVNTTTIYLLNLNINSGLIEAIAREFKTKPTTTMPIWLQTTSTVSSTTTVTTTSTTASTDEKYNANTDVLVILGEDSKN